MLFLPGMMDLSGIRSFCLSLPAVTEDIKWEQHLCFSVGAKMFLITSPYEVPVTASVKVSEDEFHTLITRAGIRPASDLGRYHWIEVDDISRLSAMQWRHYLTEAHRLVASKLPKSEKKRLGLYG